MNHNPPPSEPVVPVPAETLCKLFNEGDYIQQLSQGQLRCILYRQKHLTQETAKAKSMPFCTMSSIYRYVDRDNVWHAEVHQYDKPDGTLGASKKPDPKRLRKNGKIWKLLRH